MRIRAAVIRRQYASYTSPDFDTPVILRLYVNPFLCGGNAAFIRTEVPAVRINAAFIPLEYANNTAIMRMGGRI